MGALMESPEICEEEEAYLFAWQLAGLSALSMTLRAAMELGVLSILRRAGGGVFLSPTEIAAHLPTRNADAAAMLDRLLRLLASYSIVRCSTVTVDNGAVVRRYGLAPVCKWLMEDDDGVSLAPILHMSHEKAVREAWYYLKEAVVEGSQPFEIAHGVTSFEYYNRDIKLRRQFHRAMSDLSTITMKKILDTYIGFEGIRELLDVGGGIGSTLEMIVSKYPHLKAINFDLNKVIEDAPALPGLTHVAGDMFVKIPRAEALLMKWILHDWSDERCLKVLKNCYDALPDSGMVIVIDLLLPVTPETTLLAKDAFSMDMYMMVQNPGGKERTLPEFEALARAAGFRRLKAVCCVHGNSVMEFHK